MYSHTILIGRVKEFPKERGPAVTIQVITWREDAEGNRRETINFVEVFLQRRDFAKSLKPGDMILAEGTFETSNYMKNGQTVYFTSLKTIRIQRFDGPAALDQGGAGAGPPRRDIKVVSQTDGGVVVGEATTVVRRRHPKSETMPAMPDPETVPTSHTPTAASRRIVWSS